MVGVSTSDRQTTRASPTERRNLATGHQAGARRCYGGGHEPEPRPDNQVVNVASRPVPGSAPGLAPRTYAMAVVAILVVGAILRLQQVIRAGFPLGDGGLFHATIEGIRGTNGLPEVIAYNGDIPFVYPPLGFVVGAVVSALPGVGTETVLRFLPALFAIAGLALVIWCATRMLNDPVAGMVAGAIVAVMPQSYDQVVAGGGITRGLGVMLALAAIGTAAGSSSSVRRGAVVGLLLGLAGLAHPQVAIFALVSVAFVWWWRRAGLSRAEVLATIAVAAVCVVPWLALLAARGQLDALLSGGQRLDLVVGAVSLLLYPGMQVMHGGIPNVGVIFALAGVIACMFFRRWSIVLWLLVVHILNCPPFVSAVAWAIAGAAGLVEILGVLLPGRVSPRAAAIPLVIVTLVAVLSASASPADPGSKQQPLLPDQVAAIHRLAQLPDDARLAVVTSETWGNDLFGEWLPALSGKTVVTTPQGSEWLGPSAFNDRRDAHAATQDCSRQTADCIASAIEQGELDATHIVIPRGSVSGPRGHDDCCPALLETIRDDSRFEVVMDDAGVLVAAWR